MNKKPNKPNPVSGSDSKRQDDILFEQKNDSVNFENSEEFEAVSVPIDFWDYKNQQEFIGVFLNKKKHEPTGLMVYLFSEFDSHKIVMIPEWHSLHSLDNCEDLGCTVYKLIHNGQAGKNDYHRVSVFKGKRLVDSRLDELPNEYR